MNESRRAYLSFRTCGIGPAVAISFLPVGEGSIVDTKETFQYRGINEMIVHSSVSGFGLFIRSIGASLRAFYSCFGLAE